MKKIISTLFALLLLLSGCSGGTEPSVNLEANRAFKFNACATEDAFYFGMDQTLFYFDKTTGITGPLCGKPECLHNDSSCNAHLLFDPYGLCNYNGRIYWVDEYYGAPGGGYGYRICSVAYDGTDRRVEQTLDSMLSFNLRLQFTPRIHRGYLFLAFQPGSVVDGEYFYRNTVIVYPLDSEEEPQVIIDDDEYTVTFEIQPYGDALYILTAGANANGFKLRRWDIQSGTLETLYDGQLPFTSPDGQIPVSSPYSLWVTDNEIFLDGTSRIGTYDNGNTMRQDDIYRFDLSTGEFEPAFFVMTRTFSSSDFSENVFIDIGAIEASASGTSATLVVKDLNGQTLFESAIDFPGWLPSVSGADESYVYVRELSRGFTAIPLDGGDPIELFSVEE